MFTEKYLFGISCSWNVVESLENASLEDPYEECFNQWIKSPYASKSFPGIADQSRDLQISLFVADAAGFEDNARSIIRSGFSSELSVCIELELSKTIYRYYWRSRWVLTLVNYSRNLLKTLMRAFLKVWQYIRQSKVL